MKFPFFRPFGLSYASGVLRFLAPAVLAVGTLVAVVLTVASSEAAGPPPALGSDFNLPLLPGAGPPRPGVYASEPAISADPDGYPCPGCFFPSET